MHGLPVLGDLDRDYIPMILERKARLLNGVAADSISQLSQMFIRFAEVPLLLYFWGVHLFGEWLIITALPIYLAISDFGLTHVAARQVVMQVANGDKDEALATYQSSAVLVFLTSSVIALLFFLLVWLLPVRDIFHIDKIARGELLAIAVLLGIKIVATMQSGMLGSALQASGHYPLFFLLMAGISLSEFLLLAITVSMGGGPLMAAGAMLGAVVLGMLVLHFMVRRIAPWFHIGLGSFRFEIIRKLAKPALAALSFPASNVLNYQGARLIIGSVLGPAAVALFVPHRQLAGFVTRSNVIGKSVVVELGQAYGANDMALFKKLSLQAFQLVLWVAMVAAIAIGVGAWFIFPLWTGGELRFDFLLFTLLLIVSIFEVLWRVAFYPASATNRHVHLAKVVLYTSIASLVFIYILSANYGLFGVSLALLVSVLIIFIYSVRNALFITKASGREFFTHALKPPFYLLSKKFLKSMRS